MTTPIAELLPKGTLREHADYALRYVGDETYLKRLKRAFSLKYHPDKNKTPHAQKNFQALGNFFEILQAPHESMSLSSKYIYVGHVYAADAFFESGKCKCLVSRLPIPSMNTDFKDALQQIYDLSEDDLKQVEARFEEQLRHFYRQIFSMKKQKGFGDVLDTFESIDKDLLYLTDRNKHDALKEKIEELKSLRPQYDRFEDGCRKHNDETSSFIKDHLLEDDVFKKHIALIYLRSAFEFKEEQTHFLLKKKTYAYFLDGLLKVPLVLLEMLWLEMLVLLLAFYILTPVFLLLAMSTAELALTSGVFSLLAWSLPLIMNLGFGIGPNFNVFEIINVFSEYATLPIARYVDGLVEMLFDVKFFGSEFTDVIFDINQQKPTEKQTGHGFFSWFDAPSEDAKQASNNPSM